ncbi:MAG: FAD/NAD(P)-binding protein [Solimonas sp.]
MTTIAIIGAGFCGTTLAVQLLRRPPVTPLNVVLINRSGLLARGVAYGTRTNSHVLNVPAGRMGALPGEEDGFLRFARRQDPKVNAASFVSRRMYGDYLETLLAEAAVRAPNGCRFRAMVGDVNRIQPMASGGARILLNNSDALVADKVVLSMGNYAPADPPLASDQRAFYSSPRYVGNPWKPDALWVVKPEQPVLLIGSGLTMLDVVLDLRDRGHAAPVYALSRRGLMPQAHRDLETPPVYDEQLPRRMFSRSTARNYLRAVRTAVKLHARAGGDWRDIIGSLRAVTPALWQALPLHERQRFMRHVRPYWETHRHRCAPELGKRLQDEVDAGVLSLIAGRISGYDERADSVVVQFRRRGRIAAETLEVGTVINCTGPENDTRRLRDPLISGLRNDGLLRPDRLGLGFEINDAYALRDHDGVTMPWLHYVGPFLKYRDWEATAVPELRKHVGALAAVLHRELGDTAAEITGFAS